MTDLIWLADFVALGWHVAKAISLVIDLMIDLLLAIEGD